jgi:hypothetical protein
LKLPDFLAAILGVFLFLFHFLHIRPKEAEKMETTQENKNEGKEASEYYTPDELACKMNLARKTIKKWTLARRIPGQVKCGGRWRYSRLAIEKAILRGELLNP